MNADEKAFARTLFENRILKADGDAFENLFTEIMNNAEPEFQQIKPWGNIGDKKNDGYIPSKGIYYQVFAPEDIKKSYPKVVAKTKADFKDLLLHWTPVNEFYFVINDKFKGVNAEAELTLKSLETTHGLKKSGFITPKDLNITVFSLSDDQIYKIVGFFPNIDRITNLNFSILDEVIGHIMHLPPLYSKSGVIKFPNWNDKIKFNNLSKFTEFQLNNGSQKLGALNTFLSNNSFLAEELQNKLISIYKEICKQWDGSTYTGDNIFWEIADQCLPYKTDIHQSAVITIMSKYFESCDILEEPFKA